MMKVFFPAKEIKRDNGKTRKFTYVEESLWKWLIDNITMLITDQCLTWLHFKILSNSKWKVYVKEDILEINNSWFFAYKVAETSIMNLNREPSYTLVFAFCISCLMLIFTSMSKSICLMFVSINLKNKKQTWHIGNKHKAVFYTRNKVKTEEEIFGLPLLYRTI